jgi:hypothetical protein
MSLNYEYYYAIIELDTGLCVAVYDTSVYADDPTYIAIPEYNEDYLMKYYNAANGKWYLDDSFSTEWSPT